VTWAVSRLEGVKGGAGSDVWLECAQVSRLLGGEEVCQILSGSRHLSCAPFPGFVFVHFGEIVHMHIAPVCHICVHMHQYAKFEVCSFTRFGDMFEDVPNFIRVT